MLGPAPAPSTYAQQMKKGKMQVSTNEEGKNACPITLTDNVRPYIKPQSPEKLNEKLKTQLACMIRKLHRIN